MSTLPQALSHLHVPYKCSRAFPSLWHIGLEHLLRSMSCTQITCSKMKPDVSALSIVSSPKASERVNRTSLAGKQVKTNAHSTDQCKSISLHSTQQKRRSHLARTCTFSWVHTQKTKGIGGWSGSCFVPGCTSMNICNHHCQYTSVSSNLVPTQALHSSRGGEEGCVDSGAYTI